MRLFTFGCSYTRHWWPTWADIMARDLGCEYHNLGVSGLGNVGIYHTILRADLEYQFRDSDLLAIVWTHWHREDRWHGHNWRANGNIFQNIHYDEKFIQNHWDLGNDIIKNSTALISADRLWPRAFQGHIMPPMEFETHRRSLTDHEQQLASIYQPHYSKNNIWPPRQETQWHRLLEDGHPSPLEHLDYLTHKVYPQLGLEIKDNTVESVERLEHTVLSLLEPHTDQDQMIALINRLWLDQREAPAQEIF